MPKPGAAFIFRAEPDYRRAAGSKLANASWIVRIGRCRFERLPQEGHSQMPIFALRIY